jgi:hypothetical protein
MDGKRDQIVNIYQSGQEVTSSLFLSDVSTFCVSGMGFILTGVQ